MNFKAQEAHVCHRNILTVEAENKKTKHEQTNMVPIHGSVLIHQPAYPVSHPQHGNEKSAILLRFPMVSHSRVCIPCRHVTAEMSSSGRS
jgi:hypothetical protein